MLWFALRMIAFAPLVMSAWAQGYPDPRSPMIAGMPQTIVSHDLNGDGRLDLVYADWQTDCLHVLLNSASGAFTPGPGSPHCTGIDPTGLVLADFNADGKTDVAVSNFSSTSIALFLGDGAGGLTLAPGSPISTGYQPILRTVADFNRDGRLDFASSNHGSNSITIYYGDGRGWTDSRVTYSTGAGPLGNGSADFNGDGWPDLAVACGDDDTVRIFLGSPTGLVQAPSHIISVPGGPAGLLVQDVNSDGRADIATVSHRSNVLTLLISDGAGGFTRHPGGPIQTGDGPNHIAVADFTGDGIPDIAVPNLRSNDITLLTGDGSGGYLRSSISPIASGNGPTHIDAGDIDSDGRADMIVTNHFGHTISIFLARASDRTPPVITFLSRLPPPNANGWNNTGVVLTWSCTDAGSGVASPTVTRTVTTEGANQQASATCVDNAGNVSPPDVRSGINIDKTPPILGTPPAGITVDAANSAGANVAYLAQITSGDNLTASPVLACSPGQGMFAVGSTTVSCTLTDLASNATTKSFQVTVRGAGLQLSSLATDLANLNLGPKDQGLAAKLSGAQRALAAGNTARACPIGDVFWKNGVDEGAGSG